MFAEPAVRQTWPWVLGTTLPGLEELAVGGGPTDTQQMFFSSVPLRLLSYRVSEG